MEKNMRQLYLTATALLVAGAFAACSSDDDAIQEQPAPEAGPVTIRATITDEPASRIALGESDGTSTKVLWTNGDAFSLKIGEETTGYTFTTALTEASATANFTCPDAPTLAAGTTVTATYPATLPTSYAEQPGTEAGLSGYLTLTATATATTGSYEDLALSFKHTTSVVKLTLTNDAFKSAQVTDITLTTADWSVKTTSTFTGDASGSVTAYLVINSTDALTEATITATCGGACYGTMLGGKTLTAGKLYKVTKTMEDKGVQPAAYALDYSSEVMNGLNSAITSEVTKVKFVAGSLKTAETDYADEANGSSAYLVTNGDCLEVHTSAKTFQINPADLFNVSNHANFAQLTAIDFNSSVALSGTSMKQMFYGCKVLTSLDLSKFTTSEVTDMNGMFKNCSSLTSITFGDGFNTSNVTDMGNMFYGCSALTSLDLSKFSTSKVTNMNNMFSLCSSLTSLDLSSFSTANVTDMGAMFGGCSALTSLDLSTFNTSNVTGMYQMFNLCSGLTSITFGDGFSTASVTNMNQMFAGCSALTSLDLGKFNTANVTAMNNMFNGCSTLTSLDLSSFNTSNVTGMEFMFMSCSGLTTLTFGDGFSTASVTRMRSMFSECRSLTSLDLSKFTISSGLTNLSGMFQNCNALTTLDLSKFNTASVTNMSYMFSGCEALTSLTFGENFSTASVTDMSYMFQSCYALDNLDLSGFTFAASGTYSNMFYFLGLNSYMNNNSAPVATIYVSADGYAVLTGLGDDYATTLGLDKATLEKKTE